MFCMGIIHLTEHGWLAQMVFDTDFSSMYVHNSIIPLNIKKWEREDEWKLLIAPNITISPSTQKIYLHKIPWFFVEWGVPREQKVTELAYKTEQVRDSERIIPKPNKKIYTNITHFVNEPYYKISMSTTMSSHNAVSKQEIKKLNYITAIIAYIKIFYQDLC